ncbi:MAG: hypothetical protein GXY83_16670 [Rhodopirellula sp.]|nr:hypothetical protein [Rhodopirellula sp.]
MSIEKKKHKWAAGGVSGYPLTHPIVGQTRFFNQFQHFIHLVDDEAEKFAHVFAIIAQWGIGKSRLAYELVSQINDTSPGWYVRDPAGNLTKAQLFHNDADRDQYLGLYLRYSQVATESHNIDNWFGYGLYKALLPLTQGTFDTSIQGQIAKEAYDRLLVRGFDEKKLAEALEVSVNHSDEDLYEKPTLVTRLCQAAYAYLEQFSIKYVLIALDELETAAEAATYGLEVEEMKYLDGRAIKLIGKAIKEEDPRGKLPWLRYVALCSPAIGNELREIRSTARRFELVELSQNAFADVSSFVQLLKEDNRLGETYPAGLVEAAYAMSGGNFGWFNVAMANIDGVISGRRAKREPTDGTVGSLFDESVRVSSRMSEYVLDHHAIDELNLPRDFRDNARELLYGQLPVPLTAWTDEQRDALLAGTNEYGEPISVLYHRVEWTEQDCGKALRAAKFTRDRDEWTLSGVDQPLDLGQLLANLSTYSIHETKGAVQSGGRYTLLVPVNGSDFVQLVSVLYPHPAAEDAARAIWREEVGVDSVPTETATHIGPSIDMLGRLNLRFRRQGTTSLIFREPDQSAAHEEAMKTCKGQSESDRARQILTGVMRALDENWEYDAVDGGLKGDLVAVTTSPGGRGKPGGLVICKALHLHPEGKVIFAWVRSVKELEDLCNRATTQFATQGRIPVIALTSSRHLVEQFIEPSSQLLKDAREYLLLYQLSSREEYVLHPIGLARKDCKGFQLLPQRFTTAFSNRLQAILRPLRDSVHGWRRDLDSRGRIAWPMRASGVLKDEDRDKLFRAYRYLFIESSSPKSLAALDEKSGLDVQDILDILQRMRVSAQAKAAGYQDSERFGLFTTLDEGAEPQLPAFLHRLCDWLVVRGQEWSYEAAEQEWFWGYTWEGAKPLDMFVQWMALLCEVGFAYEASSGTRRNDKRYRLVKRSAIRGGLTEAKNWLDDEYPNIVEKMKAVFGEGKVVDYFAPLTAMRPGTKTRDAKQMLDNAEIGVNGLDVTESAWKDAKEPADRRLKFVECAWKRLASRQYIGFVYNADGYRALQRDDTLRMLNFENDQEPLWKRIGQASLFVDFALEAKERIIDRVGRLSGDLHELTSDVKGFPIQVFTRSLAKITNILEGSIGTTEPEGSTQRLQYTAPGTVGHSLKELKVGQATEKLGQLAEEVGLRLDSPTELPLEEITGSIVQHFNDMVKDFQRERQRLDDLSERLNVLASDLGDSPSDFVYPSTVPAFAELASRPAFIESELSETLAEDIETLISEHDNSSRLGNFHPLMTAAKGLLSGPKNALGRLAGQVATLENAATGYRQTLLDSDELRTVETAYGALLQAQRKPREKNLDMTDMKGAGSLKEAKALVLQRCTQWPDAGDEVLEGTGVSFDAWATLVKDLTDRRKPAMTGQQIQSLVDKGFLEVAYRLGGDA